MDSEKLYSAIIPAKNEFESLGVTVPFLLNNSSHLGEILVIVDDVHDSSLALEKLSLNKCSFLLNQSPGVFSAIKTGVQNSRFHYVIILAADEILPILQVDAMAECLFDGIDFVSGTRYRNPGRRYGGSPVGRKLSFVANLALRVFFKNRMSDFTTGYKGMSLKHWSVLSQNAEGQGWSCALKFALNALRSNLSIAEIPIISLDRPVGGISSFKVYRWTLAYLKTIFRVPL